MKLCEMNQQLDYVIVYIKENTWHHELQ